MTLTIELTPAQEARLLTAAQQQGIDLQTLAHRFVVEQLPEELLHAEHASLEYLQVEHLQEAQEQTERDPELVARVKSVRGKYAHLGVSVDDLHRERQADKLREEQQAQGQNA